MARGGDANPLMALSRDKALEIFGILSGMGYAVSVKHLRGYFFIEVPVRLRGDKCYGKEAEIAQLVERAGLRTIQTGQTLRIIGA